MFRATLFALLCFTSLICSASEPDCTKLADEAGVSGIPYYPSAEAKVIESRKISLYSAPNAKCKAKGVSAVKANYLIVYKTYKGWINVMYVARNGEVFIGWLPESKVKIAGQYDRNP